MGHGYENRNTLDTRFERLKHSLVKTIRIVQSDIKMERRSCILNQHVCIEKKRKES